MPFPSKTVHSVLPISIRNLSILSNTCVPAADLKAPQRYKRGKRPVPEVEPASRHV